MDLRTSRFLYYPRQIFKDFFSLLYPIVKIVFPLPEVKSMDETLDKILKDKVSIARFGDGEFLFIMDKIGYDYQKYDKVLSERLKEILKSNDKKVLIGLPVAYHSLKNLNRKSRLTWKSHIVWTYPRARKLFDLNKIYYNAHITRPYNNFEDKSDSARYFLKLKKIWKNRDIVLFEGEKSRLGVGNDLFSATKSLYRVLCPARNAFDQYETIFCEALRHDKAKLILIALGSTATILAYDLSANGYQALDIGNIDIEYEWYLRGATNKIKIPGKYTHGALGGNEVEDVNDQLYESQIIARIL